MKKCSKCKKTKNFSEFYIRRARRNGYRYICKLCDNKLSIKKRKAGGWKNEKKRQGKGSKHSKLNKINSQRHRDEMSDMYIRGLICKKSKNLKPKDISNELIEVWRTSLALKRALRNS